MSYIPFLGHLVGGFHETIMILVFMGIAFWGGCLVMLAHMLRREKNIKYKIIGELDDMSIPDRLLDISKKIREVITSCNRKKNEESHERDRQFRQLYKQANEEEQGRLRKGEDRAERDALIKLDERLNALSDLSSNFDSHRYAIGRLFE